MNHFPHMMAFMTISNTNGVSKMLNDFEDVNRILDELADAGIVEPMVEPIDDPNVQTDFYDWAEVVGIADEIEPGVKWA
jgi:hypothetical protein